jgi:hypothetical protein
MFGQFGFSLATDVVSSGLLIRLRLSSGPKAFSDLGRGISEYGSTPKFTRAICTSDYSLHHAGIDPLAPTSSMIVNNRGDKTSRASGHSNGPSEFITSTHLCRSLDP